jgi:hypothetical protein
LLIKVLIYEKPQARGTWEPHAKPGWYLGQAMHHNRCYRVWVKSSRSERITDTLAWLPSKLRMPVPLPADRIYWAAQDLTEALLASTSCTSPGLPDHATAALTTLTEIFAHFLEPPVVSTLSRVHNLVNPPPTGPMLDNNKFAPLLTVDNAPMAQPPRVVPAPVPNTLQPPTVRWIKDNAPTVQPLRVVPAHAQVPNPTQPRGWCQLLCPIQL